jgi:putative ABC transport system permease protein
MSWRNFFRKPVEGQLDQELSFHIEKLTEENIAAGMPPKDARRQALLDFGGKEQVKEDLSDVHRIQITDAIFWNLKSAIRFLRRSPSLSTAAILTLALGIGANSAVFSAVDAILLRPLPFPNGDELMSLHQYTPKVQNPETLVAPTRVEDWNRMNGTFQAITGYYTENQTEISGPLPEKVTEALVTPRFLQVWGVSPALGRDFTAEERHFGGPAAVLISDRYWQQRFNADPHAVGQRLRLGDFSCSVVGVMPASFLFPEREVDIWAPLPIDAPVAQNRKATWLRVIGRLKTGVTVEEARANLATVQQQLGQTYPATDSELAVAIEPLKEQTIGAVRGSLWLLFGAVTLVLLIACTNIVALLLARAAQRQHEIAVRFSLGAPRKALVWQLLTEVFGLALIGAAAGLAVAGGASRVFRRLAGSLPRVEEIRLDWRIVAYALGCAVAATLVCGLLPALTGTRRQTSDSLALSGRTQVSGRNHLQWLMVGVQVALAVTLLSGASLLVRSFQALGRVSPGFEASHVLTFRISGSWVETKDMKGMAQRIDRGIEAFASLPGAEGAATAAEVPGVPMAYQTQLQVTEGSRDPQVDILAESRFVSPEYFATMKIPLLAGEVCRRKLKGIEVMVNRSFAETYFENTKATGHHVKSKSSAFLHEGEIWGVVGDARETGLNREAEPTVYWCTSAPMPAPYYLVRTRGDPRAFAEILRHKAQEIEPARSVFAVVPLEERLDDAFSENRLRTILLAFFALTAVSLASVGLYGTLSYSVDVRRREVGLRLALGAMRGEIVKQFLGIGVGVTAMGCVIGWGLGATFGQALSGMLYGVSPTDTATLLGVTVVVLLVAAVASLVPAMRASRVEPMQVLREE